MKRRYTEQRGSINSTLLKGVPAAEIEKGLMRRMDGQSGIIEFRLDDGSQVAIKPEYKVFFDGKRKPELLTLLVWRWRDGQWVGDSIEALCRDLEAGITRNE